MAQVLESGAFQSQVLEADVPVLVDFFATWCGPCQMLAPVVDELAQALDGRARVYKIDIDQSPDLADAYDVLSVPTLIVFRDGKPAATKVGMANKDQLLGMLGL